MKFSEDQINKLLEKGWISTEAAEAMSAGKNVAKSLQQEADKPAPLQEDFAQSKTAGYYSGDKYINEDLPKSKEVAYDPNAGGNAVARTSTQNEIERAESPEARIAKQNDIAQNQKHFADLNNNVNPANVTPLAPGAQQMTQMPAPTPAPNTEKFGPPAPPAPQTAQKPVSSGGGGGGGYALPKSMQMADRNFQENAAVNAILQDRTNQSNISQAQQIAAAHDQQLIEQEKMAAELRANQAARAQKAEQQWAQLESERQSIRDTKYDPEQAWSHGLFGSNTTANKIMGAFATLLGGFGQGARVTGGAKYASNTGLDQINSAIDKDLEIQKANLDNKKQALSAGVNTYTQLLSLYQDQAAADTAYKLTVNERLQSKLANIAANTNVEKVKIGADQANQALANQSAQYQVELQQYKERAAAAAAADAYSRSEAGQFDAFIKRNPNHPLAQLPREQGFAAWRAGQAPNAAIDYTNEINKGKNNSGETKDKLDEAAKSLIKASGGLKELHKKKFWTPADRAEAKELEQKIRDLNSVINGQGTRDEAQRNNEQSLTSPFTLSSSSIAAIDVMERDAKRRLGISDEKIEER